MIKTLKKLAKVSHPNSESMNEIIRVRLTSHSLNVAEVWKKSNALDEENIAKKLLDSASRNPSDLSVKTSKDSNDTGISRCSRLPFGAWMKARQPIMRY